MVNQRGDRKHTKREAASTAVRPGVAKALGPPRPATNRLLPDEALGATQRYFWLPAEALRATQRDSDSRFRFQIQN